MTEVNGLPTSGDVFEANKWSSSLLCNPTPDPKLTDARRYLTQILSEPGAFLTEEYRVAFAPDGIGKSKVFGAGGLGCEILKNLALSGFKDIHVIDMADVGSPKASVAAAFVEKRVRGVKITPYVGKIQDKDEDYYMQFDLVICGLDSIEARRWINEMLVGMVDMENPASLKPLVDGGTEGFKGQARVILPTLTSCLECQLDMHAPRAAVPLCTIATIPRQPSHCIEWAHQIAWPAERKDDVLDTDDPDHITWLYTRAANRAQEFGIDGVTYSMTQGVVKNIIPAIASTNAIIAASCCNEAFKILSGCNPTLGMPVPGENNYMMYTGDDGVYTYTFSHERKEDCPVCGTLAKGLEVRRSFTLEEFLEQLRELPEAQLKNPSVSMGERSLYYAAGPLQESTRPNLKRKLADMVDDGDEVAVTDPAYQTAFRFKLSFRD